MRCKYCYGEVRLNENNEYICSVCKKKIDIGESYKLVGHDKIGGLLRSPVHSMLEATAVCFVNKSDIKVGDRMFFYVRYNNPVDNGLHSIHTTTVKSVVDANGVLTVCTHNTKYEFRKNKNDTV
jgi:hypothetical protein